MNEGWASYWHSTIMTRHGLTDAEVVDYADHHSGTMATSPHRLNPYKLGIELFRDIEERWNTGRFGPEYDACDDLHAKEKWDKQLGLGREKIFEVRRIHNDVTFIDAFLTPEFCIKHKLFSFAFNEQSNYYEIISREFPKIKQQLLGWAHQPWTPVHLCRGRQLQKPRRAVFKAQISGGRAEARLCPRHAGKSAASLGQTRVYRNDRRRQDRRSCRSMARSTKRNRNKPSNWTI